MNPSFWHDYAISIAIETRYYRDEVTNRVYPEYRVHGQDEDGKVLLGAKSLENHSEAFWRLCEFIDGELARRASNRPS